MTDVRLSDGDLIIAREHGVSVEEVTRLLVDSGLAARRPADDPAIVADMIANANLLITARHRGALIGFSRTLTDFSYVGYLSDLAVAKKFQRSGIGRRLIEETRKHMGPRSMLVLLAAPAAVDYYPALGFSSHSSAWILRAHEPLR